MSTRLSGIFGRIPVIAPVREEFTDLSPMRVLEVYRSFMSGIALVALCFLCVFLFRDAQLLSSGDASSFRWRLVTYCLLLSCWVVASSRLRAATPVEIVSALKSSKVWGISVGLHIAGAAICIALRHFRLMKWAWLMALFPSPILTLVLLGISTMSPAKVSDGMAPLAAVLAAVGWTVIVGATSELGRHIGGSDSEFAVDFAAASNATALALLPLAPYF
jgi:hypothetical protein